MGFTFAIKDNLLVLDSKWGSIGIFYFITFLGLLISLISLPFLFSYAQAAEKHWYSILVSAFASFMGLIMLWTGVRSPAKGYSEIIIFSKPDASLTLTNKKQSLRTLKVSFTDIMGVHVHKGYSLGSTSAGRSQSMFHLYLVLNNGSVFWLASNSDTRERLDSFLTALRQYSGMELPETKLPDIASPTGFQTNPWQSDSPYASQFVINRYTKDRQVLQIKPPKLGFPDLLMVPVILLLFLGAPLLPFFAAYESTDSVSVLFITFASIFNIIWYTILAIVLILQFRKVAVRRIGSGLELLLLFPVIPYLNRRISISGDHLTGLVIHRVESGHFVLVAHLSRPLKDTLGWLLSRSIAPEILPHSAENQSRTVLPIARVEGWNIPGKGPLMEDLLDLKNKLS